MAAKSYLQIPLAVLLMVVFFCSLMSHMIDGKAVKYNFTSIRLIKEKMLIDRLQSSLDRIRKIHCTPNPNQQSHQHISSLIVPPGARSFYSACPKSTFRGDLLPMVFHIGPTRFASRYRIDQAAVRVYAKPMETAEERRFKLFLVKTSPEDSDRDAATITGSDIISTRNFTSEDVPHYLELNAKPLLDKMSQEQLENLENLTLAVGVQDGDGNLISWRDRLVGVRCDFDLSSLEAVPEFARDLGMRPLDSRARNTPGLDLVSYHERHPPVSKPPQETLCSYNRNLTRHKRNNRERI